MSEEEKEKEKNTNKDEGNDIITDSVALMRSKIIMLEKELGEKNDLIETLTTRLDQATEFIEGDQKKMILAEIKPKVDVPDEILMLKTLDELKDMKKTLDVARIPAFKSGTPIYNEKKPSARQELDSMFDKNMSKLRGN